MSVGAFVQDRAVRAMEEDAAVGRVVGEEYQFMVKSSSSDSVYEVDMDESSCTCMDWLIRGRQEGKPCKHQIRVEQLMES